MGGREGDMLLDTRFWLAVCRADHDFLHNNPKWARVNGYLLSRSPLRRAAEMAAHLAKLAYVPEKEEDPF
jgi:hypothetical protein